MSRTLNRVAALAAGVLTVAGCGSDDRDRPAPAPPRSATAPSTTTATTAPVAPTPAPAADPPVLNVPVPDARPLLRQASCADGVQLQCPDGYVAGCDDGWTRFQACVRRDSRGQVRCDQALDVRCGADEVDSCTASPLPMGDYHACVLADRAARVSP